MNARLAVAAGLARAAWRVLVGGTAHPLAEPDRSGLAGSYRRRLAEDACRRGVPTRHPGWCSQNASCEQPHVQSGTAEWSHARMTVVEHLDGVADAYLIRMDDVGPDDVHRVHQAVVLTADGSYTADQAEAFGLAVLAAAHQLRAGLDGHPGGVAQALADARSGPARTAGDRSDGPAGAS